MRFVFAIISFVLAAVLIGLGTAQRTILSTPDEVSVSTEVEGTSTVTVVDGLVLARSAFHHSMNYRSAVIVGRPRRVEDEDERARALDAIVDQVVPGRSTHLRAHTRKELAATSVLALPLYEASVKARTGGPIDDEADIAAGDVWAGVIPTGEYVGTAERGEDVEPNLDVPDHVLALSRV